ncbi:MAG TPA: hypothetical protein DHU96_07260 [Actinobacteria bacterium]|nr:hypothetical protein [Actinomycetota bacterium]
MSRSRRGSGRSTTTKYWNPVSRSEGPIPVVMGGATTVDNLQLLCGACNRDKGADL